MSRRRRLTRYGRALSEAELIKRVRAGEDDANDAFERLVALHENKLRSLCRRLVRRPDQEDEAWQVTLVAFWRGLGKFEARNGAQLRTWLYRVCVNSVNGLYRRHVPELDGRPLESIPAIGSDPEAIVVENDWTRWAMDQLPEQYRTALALDDLGFKAREIAEILGVQRVTVSSRLHKGRQGMKGLFEEERQRVRQRSLEEKND